MRFSSLKRRLGTFYLQEMSFDSWKEEKEVMIIIMIMMIIDDHYDHQVIILYVLC